MKTKSKKLLTMLLCAVMFVMGAVFFTACTNDPEDDTDYVVYVLYPDGSGVEGVSVQWCTSSTCSLPFTTDSNGKATNSSLTDGEEYYIRPFSGVPDGYTYAQYDENSEHAGYYSGATATANSRTVTITLVAE